MPRRVRDTRRSRQIKLRQKSNFQNAINAESIVQSCAQKYFVSPVGQIISINSGRPASSRGTLAIVTNVGRDAVDAKAPKDERRLCPAKPFGEDGRSRTAKSCGLDASTLASTGR